jgi:hypothetical protein
MKNYSAHELNTGKKFQANEYDVRMYAKFQDVCKYRYFYMNLTLFYLFLIYIIYYYETNWFYSVMEGHKLWGFLQTLGMLWGVAYTKLKPSACRNKSLKFKPCRDKKSSSWYNMHQLNENFGEILINDMKSIHAKFYEFIVHSKLDIDLQLFSFSEICRLN